MPEVNISGPGGRIEARYHHQPSPNSPVALILHPHPQFGGTMNNQVVYHLYYAFQKRGFSVLRFNFRGVGRSEGSYSGWDGEVGDVAAAASFARGRTGVQALRLAGFSFGSWVGAKFALADGHIERFIALGIPVTANIDGRTFEFLDRPPAPMLIVQGARDRYGSREGVLALAERLRAAGGGGDAVPVEVRFVENADHFFTGHLTQLAAALRDGLGLEEA